MKVLISDDLAPECAEIFKKGGIEVDTKVGLAPDALKAIIGDYDGLVVRSATKVTADLLSAAAKLKVIGRAGAGVDNIDVKAAMAKGAVVMNTPGGNSVAVAELTLAMMFGMARSLPQATASTKAGKWEKKVFAAKGRELTAKTLGIVGFGKIGIELSKRAQGLCMKVIAYDPFITAERAAEFGVDLVSFDELVARADYLSFHLPLNEQTKHMVDAAMIAKMKKGAYLINCARGGVVDEMALAKALHDGHLAGAALDVFEQEPADPANPLFQEPNFICTPHLGASSVEAQEKVGLQIAEQMVDFLNDGKAINVVKG
ncbi:MAG: hypothetical protein LBM75_07135 [Myxococcales bacterium]|jgi:D-3-phosphoglycerate dehydrogenase/(S)-sulfolactate dehydrogenase|nr:hypothetical protein [Myxococcales bacterium]